MSDEKLRVLERRWSQTGAVEDEQAYLRERVRVGDLSKSRFDLAKGLSDQEGSLVGLFTSLEQRDIEASQRARLATANRLKEAWASDPIWAHTLAPLLALAETHLLFPSADSFRELREWIETPIGGSKKTLQLRDVVLAAVCHVLGDFESEALLGFNHRCSILSADGFALASLRVLTMEGIVCGVRREVVPWLVGLRDPLRERVEARQAESESTT